MQAFRHAQRRGCLRERGVLSAVQAPGVDAQEDVEAVTGPLGDLGRRHSPFGRFMSTYEHTNSCQLVVAACDAAW